MNGCVLVPVSVNSSLNGLFPLNIITSVHDFVGGNILSGFSNTVLDETFIRTPIYICKLGNPIKI